MSGSSLSNPQGNRSTLLKIATQFLMSFLRVNYLLKYGKPVNLLDFYMGIDLQFVLDPINQNTELIDILKNRQYVLK